MDNNRESNLKKTPLLILLAMSVLLVTAFVVFASEGPNQSIEPASTPIALNNQSVPYRVAGSENASVTITEFSDFGCITCRAWHQAGIKDQILEKYGDQVNFVWRDFPVITANSPKAAQAGLCAFDQDRFWDYHDLVYENYPNIRAEHLKQYAVDLGLDTDQFDDCLDSAKYEQQVEQDLQTALSYGFRGTPSFLVNEQKLIGPPSFEQLSTLIDEIIATSN